MASSSVSPPVGPVDASLVPRYVDPATFARLPRIDQVDDYDVAVVGIPFDSGVSFRSGARFGPSAVREASRLLRPYHPALEVEPFATQQVVDAGDVVANPFDIGAALEQIQSRTAQLRESGQRTISIGGDHTIALPIIRAIAEHHGPLALLHFDAHLDTWDTYFGEPYTHGTPFRRAAEEGLLHADALTHVGIRGPLYSRQDLVEDERLGFGIISTAEVAEAGTTEVIRRIRANLSGLPVYVSVDIDVLDPAHAPGTGTPEAGGLTSRELIAILRGLHGLNIVGADVVEVCPPYDHAQITAVAAAHVVYEFVSLMAVNPLRSSDRSEDARP